MKTLLLVMVFIIMLVLGLTAWGSAVVMNSFTNLETDLEGDES